MKIIESSKLGTLTIQFAAKLSLLVGHIATPKACAAMIESPSR
jgi:hypothetical protein